MECLICSETCGKIEVSKVLNGKTILEWLKYFEKEETKYEQDTVCSECFNDLEIVSKCLITVKEIDTHLRNNREPG